MDLLSGWSLQGVGSSLQLLVAQRRPDRTTEQSIITLQVLSILETRQSDEC